MASSKATSTRSKKKTPPWHSRSIRLLPDAFRINKTLMLGLIVLSATIGAQFAYTAFAATVGSTILAKAASQVGVHESPMGSNRGPAVNVYTQNHAEAWCADFASWIYWQSGHPFAGGISGWRIASTGGLQSWFISHAYYWNRSATAPTPIAGDLMWEASHVYIVDHVSGTTVYLISGNYADAVSRSAYANYRNQGVILGWGRLRGSTAAAAAPVKAAPPPAVVAGTTPSICPSHVTIQNGSNSNCVKYAQQLLNRDIKAGLAVDGSFGPATLAAVKRYQTLRHLAADGVVGPITWANLIKG